MLLTHWPLGPCLGPGPRGAWRGASGGLHTLPLRYSTPHRRSHPLAPRRTPLEPGPRHGPRAHELETYGVSSIRGFKHMCVLSVESHKIILITCFKSTISPNPITPIGTDPSLQPSGHWPHTLAFFTASKVLRVPAGHATQSRPKRPNPDKG